MCQRSVGGDLTKKKKKVREKTHGDEKRSCKRAWDGGYFAVHHGGLSMSCECMSALAVRAQTGPTWPETPGSRAARWQWNGTGVRKAFHRTVDSVLIQR